MNNPYLSNNWNEGYYNVQISERINGRYEVFACTGQGAFSNVVRARDIAKGGQEVAIKIMRLDEHAIGSKEAEMLRTLNDADPEDKFHCLRLFRFFYHKQHMCLAIEPLAMNLRELLKKHGKDVGISIAAVRSYTQQLFTALKLLKRCNIIHADIKPDNILVNETKTMLKLCDFGGATHVSDGETTTPYVMSRYYRAPEIILGLRYDCTVDMWSAGATVYELFTGKFMFRGSCNNQMLKLFMDLKGKISNKMVRRGRFKAKHFDDAYSFLYHDTDKVTQKDKIQKMPVVHKSRNLSHELFSGEGSKDESIISSLTDFLDKVLVINPRKRPSLDWCLSHPFIAGK